jgi:hypothetical protein
MLVLPPPLRQAAPVETHTHPFPPPWSPLSTCLLGARLPLAPFFFPRLLPGIFSLQVYVKVTMVDSAAGRYSLSMNLCSQSDGRDLDPTHVESEADRRGGKGGGDEPRRDLSAALQVRNFPPGVYPPPYLPLPSPVFSLSHPAHT